MKDFFSKSDLRVKIALSIVLVVFLCAIGTQKKGFHGDEIYTFGLANNSQFVSLDSTTLYSGDSLWSDYADVVTPFDFARVFSNQTNDVHPPLYYIFIHIVSSLFAVTKWTGLSVNIIFAVACYWQLISLCECFIAKKQAIFLASIAVTTMAFTNAVMFLRMYILLMFFTQALLLLLLHYTDKKLNLRFFLLLFAVLLGGAATQYYFLIYAVFACGLFGMFLAFQKQWLSLLICCGTAIAAGCTMILIYPAILTHIFDGYRGDQAFESFSTSDFFANFNAYYQILNQQLFAGCLTFLLCLLGITIVSSLFYFNVISKKDKRSIPRTSFASLTYTATQIKQFLLLALPAILHLALIAKVSPSQIDRYIMNVMGILFICIGISFLFLVKKYSSKHLPLVYIVLIILAFCSYKDGIPYLYTSVGDNMEILESYDTNALFVVPSSKVTVSFPYPTACQNVQAISTSKLDLLVDERYTNHDTLIVFLSRSEPLEHEEILQTILNANEGLDCYQELFDINYCTLYYLS